MKGTGRGQWKQLKNIITVARSKEIKGFEKSG